MMLIGFRRERETAMAEFEHIDRLMDQAMGGSGVGGSGKTAKAKAESLPTEAEVVSPKDATRTVLAPRVSQAERTRQILGALRPFLPVVGGALRLIDHGAAQAASRLLPLLGGSALSTIAAKPTENAETRNQAAALEKERNALRAELDLYREQLQSHEERLMKLRDALSRTLADYDTMQQTLRRITERNRLLAAGMVILFMLVIAGAVWLQMSLSR
jgi:hypothetical protein